MTAREKMVSKICPSFMKKNCNNYDTCEYCNEKINKMIDEYEKEIRAEVVDEFRNKLFSKLIRLTLSMSEFKLFDNALQETYRELKEQK